MMPADSDIADYLAGLGYGTVGTDIFYGNYPASPDNCICIFQSGGQKPWPWESLEYPGITIIVRNSGPDDARTTADEIFKDLAGLTHITINGRNYHGIEAQSSPADAGVDPDTVRKIFTLAFIVTKDMEG